MKRYLNKFLLSCVFCYLLVRVGRLGIIELPKPINSYLSDLVCLPLVLHSTFIIIRYGLKRDIDHFSLQTTLLSALYFSVLFEFILPKISMNYTSDYWDVLFYFLGALTYYFLQKKKTYTTSIKQITH